MRNYSQMLPRAIGRRRSLSLARRVVQLGLIPLAGIVWGCGAGSGTERGPNPPSSSLAGKCAPDNTLALDSRGNLLSSYVSGSLSDEKAWVRTYMDEAYLWYREIPAVDPTLAAYNVSPAQAALDAWFEASKTPALTASGARKDRFSFTLPTAEWNALAQTGVVGGYGIEWALASPKPPRNARVAYVEPSSQAAAAGVMRGDAVVAVVVEGVSIDFVNTTVAEEIEKLNVALFSPVQGRQTTFRLRGSAGVERDVLLTATQVATTPVKVKRLIDTDDGKVGYLLFNDFIVPAEGPLKDAIQGFKDAGVRDLILDLRYNGGGYLYMASQLAYMVAGTERTNGKTFERSTYNDKRSAASSSASSNMPFYEVATGSSGSGTSANTALPTLALRRVYVLTTGGTCSASESVINGLRGVDVEVVVLGAPTCGKPYGFTARDNCGLSYFPVEFQGVNQKGFGDFADGFAPTCPVADDLDHPLGDESEGLLAAALAYRGGASCAVIAAQQGKGNVLGGAMSTGLDGVMAKEGSTTTGARSAGSGSPPTIVRPPWRNGKFLLPDASSP